MDLENGLGAGKKKVLLLYLLLPFGFLFVRVVSDACLLLGPKPGGVGFFVFGRHTDFVFCLGFFDVGLRECTWLFEFLCIP